MDEQTLKYLLWGGVALCVIAPTLRFIFTKLYERSQTGTKGMQKELGRIQRHDDLKQMDADLEAKRRERAEAMKKFEEAQGAKKFR